MQFVIRPAQRSDAAGMYALRIMPGVMENTLGGPYVRLCDTQAFLDAMDANSFQFVAETQADAGPLIIGAAGLQIPANPRLRHKGAAGFMVHRDYQGQGVGSALMEAVLDVADNWLRLVRVELGVYTDNIRAIGLYEKYGFMREGVRRKSAIRGGQYVDEAIMARVREEA